MLVTLLGLFAVLNAHNDTSWSQGGPPPVDTTVVNFRIPSQPLASALEGYARACGIEVLYESSVVEGKLSLPLEGEYTPEMALQMLLSGTELRVRYARKNAITLSAHVPEDEANLPPATALEEADLSLDTLKVSGGDTADAFRLREFGTVIQLEIERALRQNEKTRSGNYRVNVSLWVDASRKIRRVTLAQSTGDVERDASIPIALEGLTLTRAPPANAPQPVQLVISVRSL
ncbi:energy transducer TonB [Hyphomicrobium sp. xq]|uniref:Energy transducer TonB n=1 Tax=Hyphomicrobium album TaxID=2665159 RepID=A0A6I3KGF6_9HYPH|nr:energy transducer TonB [Hyphomicrobium album]MTD92732.1 energy transducer TonB [Hyphomicrobium album]